MYERSLTKRVTVAKEKGRGRQGVGERDVGMEHTREKRERQAGKPCLLLLQLPNLRLVTKSRSRLNTLTQGNAPTAAAIV